jgi:subtilisin-like proprotein convertase family protein
MKKYTKWLLFFVFVICFYANTKAQVTNYTMVPSSGTYTPISGTSPALTGGSADDGYYSGLPIGFTFNYLGTPYTTVSASTNGWALLGSPLAVSNLTNNLTSATPRPVLAPLWDDLEVNGTGGISYITTGLAGNQVFTLQWSNMEWNYNAAGPVMSFQLKLYEASSTVEFIYQQEGTGVNTASGGASIGITGTGTGAGNFLSLADASAAPAVSSVTETNTIGTKPATGQVYTFLIPVALDVQALSLNAPALTGCYTATENVVLNIRNAGTNPLDLTVNNVTVNVNVTGAATQNYSVVLTDNSLNGGMPLAPGTIVVVNVGTLDMTTLGTYTFNGNVVMTGDGFPSNDNLNNPVNIIISGGTATTSNHDVCAGDSVTLSLSGSSGTTIQWQDSLPGGSWNNMAGATTNPYSFFPTDTASYRALVCGTNYSTIDFANVIVTPAPTVSNTSRCGTGTISLIGNGMGTLHWYDMPAGGSLLHVGDTLTTNVTSSTTFYVASYSGLCESSRIPANVTVVPATPISLTSTSTNICDVDTVTLSVSSVNTSYNYSWTPNTSLSAATGNPVMAWPTSNITYTVSAIDTAGCFISDSVSIAVAHAPTGVLTTSNDLICSGDSVTLHIDASGGGSHNMTGPIVPIPDSNPVGSRDTITVSSAPTVLASGDIVSVCIDMTHTFDNDLDIYLVSPFGTIMELSTDNGGSADNYIGTCFSMTAINPITGGTAPFTGSYIPEGTFDIFNGENANGDWQLWVVDDLGGDVGTIDNWSITFVPYNLPVTWSSIPAGLSSTNNTVDVTPFVTTTYITTVIDSVTGCNRNYLDTVVVNALPIVNLGADTAICSNYAGITLNGTNPGASTYTWQDGQFGPTYFASLAGQYSLTIVDTNGCVNTDTIHVTNLNASVVNIDANLITIHSATLNAGNGFASYIWSTSATTQTINVNTNGTYYVTVVDQNGCVSSDTMNIVFSLGTFNPNGSETTLQLFPNPSQGAFNLSINNLETTDLMIDVIDMNGSVVYNRIIGSVSGSTVQSFNLEELRSGAYNLRVIANGKTTALRFIIN